MNSFKVPFKIFYGGLTFFFFLRMCLINSKQVEQLIVLFQGLPGGIRIPFPHWSPPGWGFQMQQMLTVAEGRGREAQVPPDLGTIGFLLLQPGAELGGGTKHANTDPSFLWSQGCSEQVREETPRRECILGLFLLPSMHARAHSGTGSLG